MNLKSWLRPDSAPPVVDMYVIGLQEAQSLTGVDAVRTDKSRGQKWAHAITRIVGSDYYCLEQRQLTGIVMAIFVLNNHQPHISSVNISYAATGFLNQSNKGGVAARFVMYNRAIAVVVTHLAAGSSDENVERRNADYHGIVRKAVFTPSAVTELRSSSSSSLPTNPERPVTTSSISTTDNIRASFSALLTANLNASPSASTTAKVTSVLNTASTVFQNLKEGGDSVALTDPHSINVLDHDLVFWLGDLNYRIDAHPSQVMEWIESRNWAQLRKHDQLIQQRKARQSFEDFQEAEISFPPTYKMARYKYDEYARGEDGELKRTPSYTDRILWRTCPKNGKKPPSVVALDYNSVPYVLCSDHRPVYCLLAVRFNTMSPKTVQQPSLRRPSGRGGSPNSGGFGGQQREIEFSHDVVDFGELPHRYCERRQILVENYSQNEATVELCPGGQDLAGWLKVPVQHQRLPPGDQTKLTLEVCLARDNNYREGILDNKPSFSTVVTFLVKPMLMKHTVEIRFKGRNSCYSMPLSDLILYKGPIANVYRLESDTSSASSTSSSSSSDQVETANDLDRAPLTVPKEIWRCVNTLTRPRRENGGRKPYVPARLFSAPAGSSEWVRVLHNLDYGSKILGEDSAVASCLLHLLGALPNPVLPRELEAAAINAGRRRDVVGLSNVLRTSTLNLENVNLIYYICGFVSELAGSWSPKDIRAVAAAFADTMLLGRRSVPRERLQERTELLCFIIEEYQMGRFELEIVTDLRGSAIWPPCTEETKRKKWKKRAGKKMKKVFR